MTRKTDYPSPEARYEAALDEVKQKLQTGELFERATPFARRVVDIPALRRRHGMTQQQFADAFGIALGTLRNWEQGRRIPDGPAQRLLEIIEGRPDVAIEVFGSHQGQSTGKMKALGESLEDVGVRSVPFGQRPDLLKG